MKHIHILNNYFVNSNTCKEKIKKEKKKKKKITKERRREQYRKLYFLMHVNE